MYTCIYMYNKFHPKKMCWKNWLPPTQLPKLPAEENLLRTKIVFSWPRWASPDCDVGRRHESTRHSARCSPWRFWRRVDVRWEGRFFGVANRGSWTKKVPVEGDDDVWGWYFFGGNFFRWVGAFFGIKTHHPPVFAVVVAVLVLLLLLFLFVVIIVLATIISII